MIAILPDKFWLWINKKCKVLPHPFNQAENGAMNLNYSPWEYSYAKSQKGLHAFEETLGNLRDFIKGKKIADLACGGGGKSIYLLSLGAKHVKGCDFSETFIKQAQNFAQTKKCSNQCEFIVGDGENTPYKDNEFDVVLVLSVLEHTPTPKKMLMEAMRILKPGGYILFNTEGYYHWLGHHLWDALPIPWLHLFTSEKQRIRLYRKVIKNFPDGKARDNFRIGKNKKGREEISYLNHLTLRHLESILCLPKSSLINYKVNHFNNPLFRMLGKMPILREMFHESILGIIKKTEN